MSVETLRGVFWRFCQTDIGILLMRQAVSAILFSGTLLFGCDTRNVETRVEGATELTVFPVQIRPGCNSGKARLYDECGSQVAIFNDALAEAKRSGKTLVVSYGAEWCIWCHVFDKHLNGEMNEFSYPVEGRDVTLLERAQSDNRNGALKLNQFAAKHLVIVHIEQEIARDGVKVLEDAGVEPSTVTGLPYIFSVSADGKQAASFNHDKVEVRRDGVVDWYRGYDRIALLAELKRLQAAAKKQN